MRDGGRNGWVGLAGGAAAGRVLWSAGTAGIAALAPRALASLLAVPPAGAEPQRYTLDPTHSFVHFEVLHFGTSTIRGRPVGLIPPPAP